MIKLQFKLPQALISRGFTRRTVFHTIPTKISDIQFAVSKQNTRSIVNHVIEQKTSLDIDKKELTAIVKEVKVKELQEIYK